VHAGMERMVVEEVKEKMIEMKGKKGIRIGVLRAYAKDALGG
jgi:hypothetical protein